MQKKTNGQLHLYYLEYKLYMEFSTILQTV